MPCAELDSKALASAFAARVITEICSCRLRKAEKERMAEMAQQEKDAKKKSKKWVP